MLISFSLKIILFAVYLFQINRPSNHPKEKGEQKKEKQITWCFAHVCVAMNVSLHHFIKSSIGGDYFVRKRRAVTQP